MFAAARRLARCWRPALVAVRVLMVRSADAQFALKIRSAKHVPQNFSAAQAGWHGASRRRRLLRGRGARKKASSECKRCALAHSYNSVGLVSSAQEWRVAARMRARCMCVRCPCALHPLTNPFAGCMAGREGCRKARGLEEDGRAVAALPRRDIPCCRTQPSCSRGGQSASEGYLC